MKSFRAVGDKEVVDDCVDALEGVNREDDVKKRKRKTGTRKCDCLFLLRGREISINEWALEVECGTHNHLVTRQLIGHPYAGRLTKAEEEFLIDMFASNSRPKDILHKLKKKFPDKKSITKNIYNARVKHKVVKRGGKSQMQYLLGNVKACGYYHHNRRCEKADKVKDIFSAHPTSVDLLRSFSNVLLMDCTYKTNRYRLPLLKIVGVTSAGMTFQVACAYMESEREDNTYRHVGS